MPQNSPESAKKPLPLPPTVHEAERASGASGAVEYGAEIDEAAAVARRQQGVDIVVRGEDGKANKKMARTIEAAVGPPTKPQPPEPAAGPLALPHFHQQTHDPNGHSFYETANRKPRKKKQ